LLGTGHGPGLFAMVAHAVCIENP